MPTEELARGVNAVQLAAELMPRAHALHHPDQFGNRTNVPPGQIWGGSRMYITVVGGHAIFAENAIIYRQPVGEFVRERYTLAMSTGAGRAAWLLPIAEAEALFLMGFISALAGPVGIVASVVVFLTRLTLFYTSHRSEVNRASTFILPTIEGIRIFANRCPQLSWLLVRSLGWETVVSGARGVDANDVANFTGKCIGGIGRAPEISLSIFLSIIGKALATSLLLRGPGMAARGSAERATAFRADLAADGIQITEARAQEILAAPCFRSPENQELMRQMQSNMGQLMPLVDGLNRALQTEQTLGAATGPISVAPSAPTTRAGSAHPDWGTARFAGEVRGSVASLTGEVRGGAISRGSIGRNA